jgi:hypothetical protein
VPGGRSATRKPVALKSDLREHCSIINPPGRDL